MRMSTRTRISTKTAMNLKGIQATIEKIGTKLDPDGDWLPTLILEGKKSGVYGFGGEAMMNNQVKDLVAAEITELIVLHEPEVVYWVTSAWSLSHQNPGVSELDLELYRQGAFKISEHKHRVEIVNVYSYTEKPKPREVIMFGRINRHKSRSPTIGKWDIMEGPEVTSEGRFPEAVKEGFKKAKGGKDKT